MTRIIVKKSSSLGELLLYHIYFIPIIQGVWNSIEFRLLNFFHLDVSTKLKETFSQKRQVTDIQLKYDKDGKCWHFGFVGFKNDYEADSALSYLTHL
jgi:RNA recognition motif-containing protein